MSAKLFNVQAAVDTDGILFADVPTPGPFAYVVGSHDAYEFLQPYKPQANQDEPKVSQQDIKILEEGSILFRVVNETAGESLEHIAPVMPRHIGYTAPKGGTVMRLPQLTEDGQFLLIIPTPNDVTTFRVFEFKSYLKIAEGGGGSVGSFDARARGAIVCPDAEDLNLLGESA